MAQYEHVCRDCNYEWMDEHPIADIDEHRNNPCPSCDSDNTYIAVTTSAAIQFKGPGWSPQGYSKHTALDKYKDQGVEVFDNKEEHDRVVRGEAEAAELNRLKAQDRAAKKVFGPDAGVKQHEAEAAVKAAGKERVDGPK